MSCFEWPPLIYQHTEQANQTYQRTSVWMLAQHQHSSAASSGSELAAIRVNACLYLWIPCSALALWKQKQQLISLAKIAEIECKAPTLQRYSSQTPPQGPVIGPQRLVKTPSPSPVSRVWYLKLLADERVGKIQQLQSTATKGPSSKDIDKGTFFWNM